MHAFRRRGFAALVAVAALTACSSSSSTAPNADPLTPPSGQVVPTLAIASAPATVATGAVFEITVSVTSSAGAALQLPLAVDASPDVIVSYNPATGVAEASAETAGSHWVTFSYNGSSVTHQFVAE